MVLEGWEEHTVSDLITGMDAGVSVNSKDQECSIDEFGILKTSAVSDGVFRPERNKLVDEAHEIGRLKEPVSANTIVISRMNTPALVGANGYVSEDHPTLFLPDRLWALKTDASRTDCRWLAYWFASNHTRFRLSALATGTSGSMKNITKGDVGSLSLLAPPLPEQRKIAEILGTWDRAIEVAERQLETARTQKRALMQQLLTGKSRFPEFEAQEWKEVRLGDLADVDKKSLSSKTNPDFEFDYISLSNVEPGRIIRPLERIVFEDAPSRARRMVEPGDLLLSTVRPNLLGFARVDQCVQECIASTGFAVVSPSDNADGSYLFHYLFSHHMKSQFHALVVGSNYPAINSTDVKKLRVQVPCLAEQRRIGGVLDESDTIIAQHRADIDRLRSEKKALMQQLLTGKRRVKL